MKITTLFLDVGGVLLTNGWDRHARRRAAEKFSLDYEEMNERHHLTFDTYEQGKLSLDQYLERVIFYEKRRFTPEEFRTFMFDQSRPFPEMIDFISALKKEHNIRTIVVSNEGRELTEYRIRTFRLAQIIDAFVSSSFVHFRKPDEDIYRIALDISQTPLQQIAYIDDRSMFIEVAGSLGIRGIHHQGLAETRKELAKLGLSLSETPAS